MLCDVKHLDVKHKHDGFPGLGGWVCWGAVQCFTLHRHMGWVSVVHCCLDAGGSAISVPCRRCALGDDLRNGPGAFAHVMGHTAHGRLDFFCVGTAATGYAVFCVRFMGMVEATCGGGGGVLRLLAFASSRIVYQLVWRLGRGW